MTFKSFAFAIVLLLIAPPVAWGENGFLYSRGDIAIIRHKLPPKLPWQGDVQATVKFDVEMRDATGNYKPNARNEQAGWYNLNGLEEHKGVMMFFKEPVLLPITRLMEYAPLDIVFVDSSGTITQILSSVKLSTLDHDIVPQKPVLAFLFLQGGVAEKLSINPGDEVENNVFKKSELIIDRDKARPAADIITTKPPPLVLPETPELQ